MCVSGRLNIQPNQQEDRNWAYLLQDSALFDNLYCSDLRKKFFGTICNNTTRFLLVFSIETIKSRASSHQDSDYIVGWTLWLGLLYGFFFCSSRASAAMPTMTSSEKSENHFPAFPDRATTEMMDCPISILSLLSLRSKGKLVHRRVWLNNGPIPGWIDSFSLHKDKHAISSEGFCLLSTEAIAVYFHIYSWELDVLCMVRLHLLDGWNAMLATLIRSHYRKASTAGGIVHVCGTARWVRYIYQQMDILRSQ